MIQLYPDQFEAVTAIRHAYRIGKRAVLFVAPCAFGKTYLFSFIAAHAAKRGNSILILAHRAELIDQISDALREFDIQHGFIVAGRSSVQRQVMVASIQTMYRRMKTQTAAYSMIIVDEAHHCTKRNSFGQVLQDFPQAKLLGVTGTPCRLSGEGLGDIFDHMIIGPSATELISSARLSPFKLFAPPTITSGDIGGLHIRGGDFVQAEATALMDKPKITGDAVSHYQKHANGKPFVAFCTGVVHAQHVAEQFRANGIEAVCIHGMMDDSIRRSIINDFRRGKISGLCSVDLISEGFDVKGIVCGLMLRPTASRGLHIQQIGRCLRLAEGKSHAVILDHVGNCSRHGLPTEEQNWTLEGTVKTPRSKPPQVTIRICPSCFAVNPGGSILCKECAFEWPIESRTVEQIEGELVEWVAEKRPTLARQEEWQARSLEQLQALAKQRGYAPSWAWIRHQARQRKAGVA